MGQATRHQDSMKECYVYKTECQAHSSVGAHVLQLWDLKILGMVLSKLDANNLRAGEAPRSERHTPKIEYGEYECDCAIVSKHSPAKSRLL